MSRTPLQESIRHLFGVTEGVCPSCNKDVKKADFRDTLSEKEYEISGLCQKCQDDIFSDAQYEFEEEDEEELI